MSRRRKKRDDTLDLEEKEELENIARDKWLRFNNFLVKNFVNKGKPVPPKLEERWESLRSRF